MKIGRELAINSKLPKRRGALIAGPGIPAAVVELRDRRRQRVSADIDEAPARRAQLRRQKVGVPATTRSRATSSAGRSP
jgi:hypothetical protein